ncbi:MAG: hypothetical protein IPI04_07815 [Ignavibacteria bacterium]|nr:hypothetical protein [Ignavibacteria bacterium]
MFKSNMDVSGGFKHILSDKQKYLFSYEKNRNNIFIEPLLNLYLANSITPDTKKSSKIFDGGFRFRGSLFDHLGYEFKFIKGGAVGDSVLTESVFPKIKSTFKYVENIENITNYDFVGGYLKYYLSPSEGMDIAAQFGRERITFGLGYSGSLALSGEAPDLDFLKLTFKYGIINYTSVFGSTVGEYSPNRDERYTKYFTANRLKLSFDKLFDVGIGETVISSRGIELGYLNPLIFYKFAEMSLQDRDNGTIFADIQTHFIKNLELQGTFFLDENILSNLSDLSKASNKTAYQLGFFWYEPAGLKNVSFIFEYTKIRPYVYTHFDRKNTYSAFGVGLGHPVGPNADQLFFKLRYNLSEKITLNLEFQKIRKGKNYYDAEGNLLRNVGGDIFQTFRGGIDSEEAYFLDGVRENTESIGVNISYEPIRNYVFDLHYSNNILKNITYDQNTDNSYAYLKFRFNY